MFDSPLDHNELDNEKETRSEYLEVNKWNRTYLLNTQKEEIIMEGVARLGLVHHHYHLCCVMLSELMGKQ